MSEQLYIYSMIAYDKNQESYEYEIEATNIKDAINILKTYFQSDYPEKNYSCAVVTDKQKIGSDKV